MAGIKHDRVALDPFTRSYVECALWLGQDGTSEADPNDGSIDLRAEYGWSDLSESAQARILADCAAFQAEHGELIGAEADRAGSDFLLTRNRHGAGFWDGDWPREIGKVLTDASHPYGDFVLVLTDDGTIESQG